jgi:DMSO/TMAO reductase YedYZ heme-binding membrane subunit
LPVAFCTAPSLTFVAKLAAFPFVPDADLTLLRSDGFFAARFTVVVLVAMIAPPARKSGWVG